MHEIRFITSTSGDLFSVAALLQLRHENADPGPPPRALARSFRHLPAPPGPAVDHRGDALARGPKLGRSTAYEDPFPTTPFGERSLHGGNFVVFPGGPRDAALNLPAMIRGLYAGTPAISRTLYRKGKAVY